jgi:hypothetical protein
MLLILLNWFFIFITTYSIGYAGLSLLKVFTSDKRLPDLHLSIISLTGLSLITTLANYSSLFMEIGLTFSIGLAVLAIICMGISGKSLLIPFRRINVKNNHPLVIIFGVGILFMALIKATGPTEIWDEGQYFLPLIRWIESYPIIPGSGLFHDRMGYNSAFHMSSAVYGLSFWFKGGMYDLNAYLFMIINFYLLAGVNRIIKNKVNHPFHDYLMLFAGIALYRQLLTSMDADYPHIFIGIVLLLLFIEKADQRSLKVWDHRSTAFLIIAIYLVTVKFLAIFYLLFPGILLLLQLQQKQWKLLWMVLGLGVAGFFPWVTRNVVMTGYLIYPLYLFDFFQVDWKIPVEMAQNNYLYVGEHAKTLVERHTLFYDGAANIPVNEWLPQWWVNHATINLSALITAVIFPPSLLVLFIYLVFKGKTELSRQPGHLLSLGIVLIFLVFWFFNYPNVRFGWAWILFLIVFTLIKTHESIFKIPQQFIRISAIVILSLTMVRGVWKSVAETEHFAEYLIKPVEVREPETFFTKKIGAFEIMFTPDMHCWGAKPPCSPFYYEKLNIVPRGESFLEGFKVE